MADAVDFNNRRFKPVSTTENGEVGEGTVFCYRQEGPALWATYDGGGVSHGHLVGRVCDNGTLMFRYHHLSGADAQAPEPVAGLCHSRLEVLPDGRYRLFEEWQWTSGDRSSGTSVLEEISA